MSPRTRTNTTQDRLLEPMAGERPRKRRTALKMGWGTGYGPSLGEGRGTGYGPFERVGVRGTKHCPRTPAMGPEGARACTVQQSQRAAQHGDDRANLRKYEDVNDTPPEMISQRGAIQTRCVHFQSSATGANPVHCHRRARDHAPPKTARGRTSRPCAEVGAFADAQGAEANARECVGPTK